MKKELYEVTRVRGDEKKELGSYLLKPGPEAAMDFFHNILKRDDRYSGLASSSGDRAAILLPYS